jgi:hypothetical protein
VAQLGDGLVGVHEVADDPLDVGVVADVLGGAATGDDQGDVVGWVDVGERDIGGPGVAQR